MSTINHITSSSFGFAKNPQISGSDISPGSFLHSFAYAQTREREREQIASTVMEQQ